MKVPMQNGKKKTKSAQLVHKPYLKGRWASALAARRSGRVALYLVMSAFVFFFLGQLMAVETAWLRVVVNLAVLALLAFVFYSDGARMGEADAAFAEIAYTRRQEGRPVSDRDLDRCFHPAKGFFTALAGTIPFVLLCLAYAPLARPAVYSLGALPGWLEPYQKRPEIGLALAYYQERQAFGLLDALRLIVRLLVFPFVNLAGADNAPGILWVERLSPLLVMCCPMAYGLGYSRGEHLRAMLHGGILIGQRKKRRQEKKAKRAAGEKPRQLL